MGREVGGPRGVGRRGEVGGLRGVGRWGEVGGLRGVGRWGGVFEAGSEAMPGKGPLRWGGPGALETDV